MNIQVRRIIKLEQCKHATHAVDLDPLLHSVRSIAAQRVAVFFGELANASTPVLSAKHQRPGGK